MVARATVFKETPTELPVVILFFSTVSVPVSKMLSAVPLSLLKVFELNSTVERSITFLLMLEEHLELVIYFM